MSSIMRQKKFMICLKARSISLIIVILIYVLLYKVYIVFNLYEYLTVLKLTVLHWLHPLWKRKCISVIYVVVVWKNNGFFSDWYINAIILKNGHGNCTRFWLKSGKKYPFLTYGSGKNTIFSKSQGKIFFRTAENPVIANHDY